MAQDDNLEHYLTTSRDKIHGKNFGGFKWGPKFELKPQKKICGANWSRNDFFYSNIVEGPFSNLLHWT